MDGRVLVSRTLRGRRFSIRVSLPVGDTTVRVTTVATDGRRAGATVRDVFGLPAAARPRVVAARRDAWLTRRLGALVRDTPGTTAFYVQSLTSGAGAAWNARARFPAASTVKLAIAAAVLAEHDGVPGPGSYVGGLLREMIVPSDDAAANALEVWLAGSTSAGSAQVNALMRSIGLLDTIMYGGYEITDARRSPAAALRPDGGIPVRVDEQPAFGVGKYTTAADMTRLHRAIWLASENRGLLRAEQPGFTAADGRHLLWLLAHVRDTPKLDRTLRGKRGVAVLHKAGWINDARHDTGLVFWRGGVFVAGVMTWNARGAGPYSDVLAGRVAALSLERFRRLAR